MRLRNHIGATAALVVAGAANALDFPDFTVDPDPTRRPPRTGGGNTWKAHEVTL